MSETPKTFEEHIGPQDDDWEMDMFTRLGILKMRRGDWESGRRAGIEESAKTCERYRAKWRGQEGKFAIDALKAMLLELADKEPGS